MKEEKKWHDRLRRLEKLLFVVYLGLLCYFLFFADSMGRNFAERTYRYNLKPFQEISRFIRYRKELGWWSVSLNLAGNVLAFVPFGAFLPRLFPKCRKFLPVAWFGFEFSLCVELIQLTAKVGSFDVDDILLNTLGGMLGYAAYRVTQMLHRRYGDRHEKKESL